MPSRPNYLLFLAIACSVTFVQTEANAYQTEVAPNFPSRLGGAIKQTNSPVSSAMPKAPAPDTATSIRNSSPRMDYKPARERVKATPVGSNAYSNPLRRSDVPAMADLPRPQTRLPRAAMAPQPLKPVTQSGPAAGQYRPGFGTVMTFPASSPAPYQAVAPKSNPATSFSFGDTSPMPSQTATPQLHPVMLQRQFALQQHVMEQQKQIERLQQQLTQNQVSPTMAPPASPPAVESQNLTDDNSPIEELGARARIPAQQVSTPVTTNFSSPAETKIIPSSAIPAELATSVIGPEALVEGTPDEFEIIVTNSGDVTATDVVVQITVPDDITVSRLHREAWLDQKKRTVSWKIPSIAGREREVIRYSAVSKEAGRYGQTVVIGMGSNLKGDTSFETVVITAEEFQAINSNTKK